jgi:hypothetical protein
MAAGLFFACCLYFYYRRLREILRQLCEAAERTPMGEGVNLTRGQPYSGSANLTYQRG